MIQKPGSKAIRVAASLGILAAALAADPGQADIDAKMEADGWEELTFDDYVPNQWSATDDGVQVRSDGSVSIVFSPVSPRLADTPLLRWRWRSDTPASPSDLTQDSGEDRLLSLIVAFPYQSDRATFRESLLRSMVVALRGSDAPGRTISYTWGGDQPRGSLIQNLRRRNTSATLILRTPDDSANVWHEETVDVAADFREIYGWDPPDPTFIGLSSDSDDTGIPFTAEVGGIEFLPRPSN